MDSKLLCPTLSVVLVKTIKALCEINIKYDSKLEITGSLHVRSDGQKVLTCVLDEETVRGQQDAARIAELAARLSMAAATFPFAHLQIPSNNHSQQVAEALLSSMQGDVHLVSASVASGGGVQQQQQLMIDSSSAVSQVAATSQLSVFHHKLTATGVDANGDGCTEEVRQMLAVRQHQDEIRQSTTSARNNHGQQPQLGSSNNAHHHQGGMSSIITGSSSSGSSSRKQQRIQQQQQQQQQQQLLHGDISKIIAAATAATHNRLTPVSYSSQLDGGLRGVDEGGGYENGLSGGGQYLLGNNHVKLPDMQTLAHSLPKYPPPSSCGSRKLSLPAASPPSQTTPSQSSVLTGRTDPTAFTSEGSSGSPTSLDPMQQSGLDPMMSINIEVQSETDTEGNVTQRKRFQCMFCGIFLSTKCYLKNHVNAMHTRARVYPCELCERYFYSAGALRIHKLRNHWTGAKKHICATCGETFLLPIELRKHVVKKHCSGGGLGSGGGRGHNSDSCLDRQQLLLDEELKLEDGEIPMPHLRAEGSLTGHRKRYSGGGMGYHPSQNLDAVSPMSSENTPPCLDISGHHVLGGE